MFPALIAYNVPEPVKHCDCRSKFQVHLLCIPSVCAHMVRVRYLSIRTYSDVRWARERKKKKIK